MSFSFTDFQARFPELATVDESFYNEAKKSAQLSVQTLVWLDKTDEGVKLMTAHIIALSSRGGNAGAVTSEKVGDLERSYGKVGEGSLQSTSYGQEFDRVMRSLIVSPMIIC